MQKVADGFDRYDWDLTWTTNGRDWHTRLFETLDECREHARELLSANEENPDYMFFARRHCTVAMCDLLDETVPAARVRVMTGLSSWTCGGGADRPDVGAVGEEIDASPNLTDRGRELIKGRLIKFVVGTCGLGVSAPAHMVEVMPEVAKILLEKF